MISRRHRRPWRVFGAFVGVLAFSSAGVSGADPAQSAGRADEPGYRRVVFPVEGAGSYSNDWHNPRSGGRVHLGNDVFAPKGTPLLAVADGRVSFVRVVDEGNAGRMLTIKDADGWSYRYIHLNNDNPGTDDGSAPPELTVAPGIELGARVTRGQRVAYVGDSGNAEGTAPHLHFEVVTPDGEHLNPYAGLRLSQGLRVANLCRYDDNPPASPNAAGGRGYWALDAVGGVFSYGDVGFHGSVPSLRTAGVPVGPGRPVAIESTPDGGGYWILDDKAGVFSFGNAAFHGSIPDLRARGVAVGPMKPVAIEATPDGGGYWILDDRAGVFAFGNAAFHGSIPDLRARGVSVPERPEIVAMGAAPGGEGYWLFDRQGGVFSFGAAPFYGSVPGAGLCEWAPIVAAAPSASGRGYLMLAEDGRVWTFGDARYRGGLDTTAGLTRGSLLGLAAGT